MDSAIDPPAQGWYNDPTGRHELRWFSAGTPTDLVRDAGRESWDTLSIEERALPATSGPGLLLPEKTSSVDGQPGPVAWWDTAIPERGEPTIADIGISGVQGYELILGLRLGNRVFQRLGCFRWLAVVALVGLANLLIVIFFLVLLSH